MELIFTKRTDINVRMKRPKNSFRVSGPTRLDFSTSDFKNISFPPEIILTFFPKEKKNILSNIKIKEKKKKTVFSAKFV